MWAITQNDTQRLLLIKTNHTFNFSNLQHAMNQIYIANEGRYACYNRFADLSDLSNVEVDINTLVESVGIYRNVNPPENVVKIAIYTPVGVIGSLAQLLKLMTESDNFNIHISSSLKEWAEYLKVDEKDLSL